MMNMMNFLLSASAEMPANGDTAFIIGVGGSVLVILIVAVISLVFILLGKYMSKGLRMKKTVNKDAADAPVPLKGKLPANTVAAISAAIYRYMEDSMAEENTIITIDRAAKIYSPWSSKIYVTNARIFNSRR